MLKSADNPRNLPFDHNQIVAAARDRLRTKSAYSTLPARRLPPTFTLSEMRHVYEAVIGDRLDQSSFRRKIAEFGRSGLYPRRNTSLLDGCAVLPSFTASRSRSASSIDVSSLWPSAFSEVEASSIKEQRFGTQ